jgi:hypothetical protein
LNDKTIEVKMKTGAFALIDCLGFKGIWKGGEHDALMSKLQSISKRAEIAAKKRAFPNGIPVGIPSENELRLEVKLLSDTVAISVCRGHNDDKLIELTTITNIVQEIIALYLEEPPYLVLRGCITYGKHTTSENFLVGPAIDEAAEYMNSAEGAFIWFLPAATDIIQPFCDIHSKVPQDEKSKLISTALEAFFPKYPIPIKNSHYLNARAVNPFYKKSAEDSDLMESSYKDAMKVGENMSIWMKRQNTLEFLQFCKGKNAALSELLTVG